MLLRLVRPVRRKESSNPYFVQRIPTDVKAKAAGMKLAIPVGDEIRHLTISPQASSIKLSLRTRDPDEAKVRQAAVASYLQNVWRSLRQAEPTSLTPREAQALAGELYRDWADGEVRERTNAMVHDPASGEWQRDREAPDERPDMWESIVRSWDETTASREPEDLEPVLGPIVDRMLLKKGIGELDEPSRHEVLHAFAQALQDAFEVRQRKADGDYAPDPKAQRFPQWESPKTKRKDEQATGDNKVSLTQLVEDWWREAEANNYTVSTHESYRKSVNRFVAFLGHDDARRVTPEDVIAFKDHRLSEVNPRTGKGVSAKTVKDSDLAGLKAIFNWAVSNRRMTDNPAQGITVKVHRQPQLRPKGFTESEAKAVLSHALSHEQGREQTKVFAAKRWAPWLCAYTGARVGEILQLRREDLWQDDQGWGITITPEAGTVKDKQARDIPLHPHLIELGFAEFVKAASEGYLFLTPNGDGETRGPWLAVKNRVREFVRQVVEDKRITPNHAWRHSFKTFGYEAGMQERVLDAICGHAPRTVGGTYGDITIRTKRNEIRKFPRFVIGSSE